MRIARSLAYVSAIVLLAVLLACSVWKAVRSHEPTYQGKSLSEWLKDFQAAKVSSPTSPRPFSPEEFQVEFVEPTHNAIRSMGTNALPPLLTLVSARDSMHQRWAKMLLARLPLIRWQPSAQDLRRSMALDGFTALGTNAQPAVPDLIVLLNDKDADVRKYAASCLSAVGPAAEQAVPALIQRLADSDSLVVESAEHALALIHRKPDLVIPVLMERLGGAGKKSGTLFALGRFGEEAKPAVALILPLLNDPNQETRTWAALSLEQIDPLVAAKAKVKSP